jgi:hypothetical protein
VTYELARALLLTEVISSTTLARALFASITQDTALPRVLFEMRALDPERLDIELSRVDAPRLRSVVPVKELMDRLPPGLCRRLLAVPVRRDAMTGTVDVAVADARDPHAAQEIGYWLDAPVRIIRAPMSAIEDALRRSVPPPPRQPSLRPPVSVRRPSVTPAAMSAPSPVFPRPAPVPGGVPAKGESDIPIPLTRVADEPEPMLLVRGTMTGGLELPTDLEPAIELSRMRPASVPPPSYAPDTERDRAVPSIIPGPPPITKRGPYSAAASSQPLADVGSTIAALRVAYDRDEVLDLLLSGARTFARKAAVFVAKQHGFVGWTCSREFGDESALQQIVIDADEPSVLATASLEGFYLGPMRADDVHAPILAVMGGATRDVAAAPVKVANRTAVILLCDELADTMLGTRRLDELVRAAGEALERILRSRK